jgi:diphosphomevalonate decarboxylase
MAETTEIGKGTKVKWRCPSNIAIVKYWGKKGIQFPRNSSLSLTLSHSYSEIEVELVEKNTDEIVELHYSFENDSESKFGNKVKRYIEHNIEHFPYLKDFGLKIYSHNSFPHSVGIASSASAFGSIALALLDITYTQEGKEKDDNFYMQASSLARLGSGSASRSVYPGYAIWGENDNISQSSNEHAIPVVDVHPIFSNMKDAVLVVEDEPKKVSSTVGHALMNEHPFAEQRFAQANNRTVELCKILKEGDIDAFISLAESEALTLHAMMMTSSDYYLLVKPGTLTAIEKIIKFRLEALVPLCFTLDAGPNVHILYPDKYQEVVEDFIRTELSDTYKKVIFDSAGKGPQKIYN